MPQPLFPEAVGLTNTKKPVSLGEQGNCQIRGIAGLLNRSTILGLLTVTQVLGVSAVQATSATERVCQRQLADRIEAITTQTPFQRARWGILLQTLDGASQRKTLYQHESDRYFIPASNVKLLTTAASLTKLGAEFRIRTSVYWQAETRTLRIVGRGDPSFTDIQLKQLAQQVQQQGITQVDRLIADDQFFQGDVIHPNWEWEDIQADYGAPVNSLILNGNTIGISLVPQAIGEPLRVVWEDSSDASRWRIENHSMTVDGSAPEFLQTTWGLGQPVLHVQGQLQVTAEPYSSTIAVPNPADRFIRQFQQALIAQQITVTQAAMATRSIAPTEVEIAAIESLPLSSLLIAANRESNNLYAESLLRQIGTLDPESDESSSLAAGISNLETTLATLGVDPASYELADGSGLSRHNLVSPDALVQTLQAMAQTPTAELYRNSLAVAGINGTLDNRFLNTPAVGRLQGKTGAMSGVAALSGYLTPVDYPPVVFSILVNQFEQPVREVRQAIDRLVLLFAQLQDCY